MKTKNTKQIKETEGGLSSNEFGVDQLAQFIPLGNPKLKIKANGTATLTLEYKLANMAQIISGPKAPNEIPFNVYAAFDKGKPDHFAAAVSVPYELAVDVDSSHNITLAASEQKILLITNADKREHGIGFTKPTA